MEMVRASATGLAAIAVFAIVGVSGCGGKDSSSSAPATSSSPASPPSATTPAGTTSTGAQADYSALLIKPEDVGPGAFVEGPPTANPGGANGVGQVFKNPDGMRTIVDTIAVYADPAAAAPLIPAMKDELGRKITGVPQPVDIGTNGFMVAGASADPAKQMEISEVVFTEGRALIDMEFDCSPGNPTPTDVLLDLARKQDAAVKSGLTG